jgi:hypothetical protein
MANYSKRDARAEWVRDQSHRLRVYGREKDREKKQSGLPFLLGDAVSDGPWWVWFCCPVCGNRRPVALARFAIRYGFDIAVSDVARFERCGCGHVGATMQIPSASWRNNEIETEQFPVDLALKGLERWIACNTRTSLPAPLRAASHAESMRPRKEKAQTAVKG